MKKLQILGSGCAKCEKLAASTKLAAEALGIDHHLEKVTDVLRFADFGVMVTPALVVDGKVAVAGRIPALDELKTLIGGTEA